MTLVNALIQKCSRGCKHCNYSEVSELISELRSPTGDGLNRVIKWLPITLPDDYEPLHTSAQCNYLDPTA